MSKRFNLSIKALIFLFLFTIFTYVFFFSFKHIINAWTFSEIHINYSLGFTKRGFLGTIMLYLESIGLPKFIFFSSIFYLVTLCNIFLFLSLINRFKKNHIFFYVFFALNPALLLFSFYDLGGYARLESFGICVCLIHALLAQKYNYLEISYEKYLKLSLIVVYPLNLLTFLIHELNILFLSFHLFTTFFILIKNNFNKITNFKYLIFINTFFIILFTTLLLIHPFSKEFAKELYNNLPDKTGVHVWIWEAIAATFTERINIEIKEMQTPAGAISLYFFIFLFYILPIFFLLSKTSKKNKHYKIHIIFSVLPFILLFFVGRDWGRWIHIIIFVVFSILIQCKEKKIEISKKVKYKIYALIFVIIFLFQFFFTRIPHCCNLERLNLNILGGIIPKAEVYYKIFNQKYNVEERFQKYR
jgi:hypothetical protein